MKIKFLLTFAISTFSILPSVFAQDHVDTDIGTCGHLFFIGVMLSLIFAAQRSKITHFNLAFSAVPYAIGSIAMFWIIDRIATF